MYFKFGLFLFVFILLIFVSDSQGDLETLSTGCSSHCTLNFDKNLGCWNKTLTFYQQTLVNGLRNYVSTLANIGYWNKENKNPIGIEEIGEETKKRMQKLEPGNIEDEDAVIEPQDYKEIVDVLVQKAKGAFAILAHNPINSNASPLEVICPKGCEKNWDPWYWMFLSSAGISIILGVIILIFVWFLDKRDTEEARLELAECDVVVKHSLQPKHSAATTIINDKKK